MGAQLTYFTIQDLLTVKKKRIFLQILHQRLYSIHVHVHVHACVFSIKGCTLQILHTASLVGENQCHGHTNYVYYHSRQKTVKKHVFHKYMYQFYCIEGYTVRKNQYRGCTNDVNYESGPRKVERQGFSTYCIKGLSYTFFNTCT